MKSKFYNLLIIGLFILSISALGQKTVVVVEPDPEGETGALNTAVSAALDPGNTIFELKRGAKYEMNHHILFTGYTLHIRAEEGDGPRPYIQAAPSRRHFRANGSLILEGLHLDQMARDGSYTGNQTIRIETADNFLIMDDCILDYVSNGFVRTDADNCKVFIKNSILRNAFINDSPGSAKVIESRGKPQDTLSIENTTIYNCGGRIFDGIDDAVVKVLIFNHNTVFNSNLTNNFQLGQAIEAKITNNVLYNVAHYADTASHAPLFSVDSIGENDYLRVFDLSKNNWYIQKEIEDLLAEYTPDGIPYRMRTNFFANQTILDTAAHTKPALLYFVEAMQVDTSNNFKEKLDFMNSPPLNLTYLQFYVENGYLIPAGEIPTPFIDDDFYALDLRYADNMKSATAGADGKPLGDQRWVPYPATSVHEMVPSDGKTMVRTFPNPFYENLTFEIRTVRSSPLLITVFDIMGKEILSVSDRVEQGNHTLSLDLHMIKPGIYIYQVYTGSQSVITGKVVKK